MVEEAGRRGMVDEEAVRACGLEPLGDGAIKVVYDTWVQTVVLYFAVSAALALIFVVWKAPSLEWIGVFGGLLVFTGTLYKLMKTYYVFDIENGRVERHTVFGRRERTRIVAGVPCVMGEDRRKLNVKQARRDRRPDS